MNFIKGFSTLPPLGPDQEALLAHTPDRSDDAPTPTLQAASSDGGVLKRSLSWLTPKKTATTVSRSTEEFGADAVLKNIRDTYGSAIAAKVESFYSAGLATRESNAKLSKSTISNIHALAAYLEKSGLDAETLPTSKANVSHMEMLHYQAACHVLESCGLENHADALKEKMQLAKKEATSNSNENILLDAATAERQVLGSRKEAHDLLRDAIKNAPLAPKEKKALLNAMDSHFKKELVQILNRQEWPILTTPLTYSINGQSIHTESIMTPAAHMSCLQKNYQPGL